jgi:hypothetical protein
MVFAGLADENILRIYEVSKGTDDFVVIVEEFHRDLHRVLWEGHQEDILKGFLYMFGFICSEPLLKEGGEGMTIDDRAVGL